MKTALLYVAIIGVIAFTIYAVRHPVSCEGTGGVTRPFVIGNSALGASGTYCDRSGK